MAWIFDNDDLDPWPVLVVLNHRNKYQSDRCHAQNHQLITDGPYRFVRHPLYTVGFATFLGIGLMATMWWLLVGLVILTGVIAWRTGREEENLLREFGEEYRTYMKRTGHTCQNCSLGRGKFPRAR